MTLSSADARRELLGDLALASARASEALGLLGEAYEQLDETNADRLEEELFQPVQAAVATLRRAGSGFAARHRLSPLEGAAAEYAARPNDARGTIERAVALVAAADGTLVELQDSPWFVEVGDTGLRADVAHARQRLDEVGPRAREVLRQLGR